MSIRTFLAAPLLLAGLSVASCSSEPATPAEDGQTSAEQPPAEAAPPSPDLSNEPIVDLRADVNRNGTVDLTDSTEDKDEDTWDSKHGAIFLANIDDDESACATSGSDVALAACNDAADEVINGTDDLLDIARLKTVPYPRAPSDAVGSIALSSRAKSYVRLFKKKGSSFAVFDPDKDTLSASELRTGVELGIEGKDVVRDSSTWDGYVDVTFSVKSAAHGQKTDKVRMRLAPLITQHHLSPPLKVYATDIPDDSGSVAMIDDLSTALSSSGLKALVKLELDDQWTQDLFESSYMAMPAVGGAHVIYVNIRSANVEYPSSKSSPLRRAGQVVFTTLRGKDVGAVQQYDVTHDGDMDSLNSFGNLETIPPYTLSGTSYPLGRQFRGKTSSFYPDPKMTTMLESQKVQPPVYIDTSWLLVGHVDETIAFVKAPTSRGWAMVVNDAAMAKRLLERASTDGYGSIKMFVGMKWLNYSGYEYSAAATIDQVLANTSVMAMSAAAAIEVDDQITSLKKETGITDAEILHLPFLHWKEGGYSVAYQVGTVNGISLGDAHYAMATPHGPVIRKRDIFQRQAEDEFAKVGITVHWVEDWDLYHRLDGEIHCGSNVTRKVPTDVHWWETDR
jgi:protein-arginine deiminase